MSLCRLCSKFSQDVVSFSDYFDDSNAQEDESLLRSPLTWLDVFILCTNITAFANDPLPHNLCLHCAKELATAMEVRARAEITETFMKCTSLMSKHLSIIREVKSHEGDEPKLLKIYVPGVAEYQKPHCEEATAASNSQEAKESHT